MGELAGRCRSTDRPTTNRCRRAGQAQLVKRIKEIAATRVRYGCWPLHKGPGQVGGKYICSKVDQVPIVRRIKQSTLAHWCELSYRSHVVAYAVDLKAEAIYLSKPLFWEATCLIDGTGTSKSIEFLPLCKADKRVDHDKLVEILSAANALSPSVPDTLYALTTALRYLKDFFEFRVAAFHYDATFDDWATATRKPYRGKLAPL